MEDIADFRRLALYIFPLRSSSKSSGEQSTTTGRKFYTGFILQEDNSLEELVETATVYVSGGSSEDEREDHPLQWISDGKKKNVKKVILFR